MTAIAEGAHLVEGMREVTLLSRVRALEAALAEALDLACPHNDAERLQLATLRSALTGKAAPWPSI